MSDNHLSKQRGQSIVLVAAALVALVLFVAITVDMSTAYYHRRTAQNGADGAALAGARQLAHQINMNSFNDPLIKVEMNDFAERNGIVDTNGVLADGVNTNVWGRYLDDTGQVISGTMIGDGIVPEDAWGVQALTIITAPTFFGGIFGLHGLRLRADAAVLLTKACGEGCVVPIALYTNTLQTIGAGDPVGQCFNIWNGDGPGNFGWLNWSLQDDSIPCDQGAETCSIPCLEWNLDPAHCNSGMLQVGEWVGGTTGDKSSGLVKNQLKNYIDTPITFVVPIYDRDNDGTGCGGPNNPDRQQYRVAGFAMMQLLSYQLSQGNQYPTDFDMTQCVTLGGEPRGGNRLSARFLGWVGGESGRCHALGTLRAPRLTR